MNYSLLCFPTIFLLVLFSCSAELHGSNFKILPEPNKGNDNSSYIELLLFIDDQMSNVIKNREVLEAKMRKLASHLNEAMHPLNVFVYLTKIETPGNLKLDRKLSAEQALGEFRRFIVKNGHKYGYFDHAMLVTGQRFKGENGETQNSYLGGVCWLDSSVSVVSESYEPDDFREIVSAMAYALARNLGIEDDGGYDCHCQKRPCTMSSSKDRLTFVEWSTCSHEFMSRAHHLGRHYCLKNLPRMLSESRPKILLRTNAVSNTISGSGEEGEWIVPDREYIARCGNGFVEPGEECDCGGFEFCPTEVAKCCDASTCKLTVNSTCAIGSCCDLQTCGFKTRTSLCRPAVGECDLPESCLGDSEFCPDNFFVQNGNVCGDNIEKSGRCFDGHCRSTDLQCKMIYGETAMAADKLFWYSNLSPPSIPAMGCGSGKGCNESDIFCGRLLCRHKSERPRIFVAPPHWRQTAMELKIEDLAIFQTHNITRKTGVAEEEASFMVLNPVPGSEDPGFVEDGTPCDQYSAKEISSNVESQHGICINRTCVASPVLSCDDVKQCNGNGRCTNLGECYCFPGFAPPYCNVTGEGGNYHSGPYPLEVFKHVQRHVGIPSYKLYAFVVIASIILLFMFGIIAIPIYIFRRKLKIWYYWCIWGSALSNIQRKGKQNPHRESVLRKSFSNIQRKISSVVTSQQSTPNPITRRQHPASEHFHRRSMLRQSYRGMEISTPVLQHSTRRDLDSLIPLNATTEDESVSPCDMRPSTEGSASPVNDGNTSSGYCDEQDIIVEHESHSPDIIQSTYNPESAKKVCQPPKRPAPRTPNDERTLEIRVSLSMPERLSEEEENVNTGYDV